MENELKAFSSLEHSFANFERDNELKLLHQKAEPFKNNSEADIKRRVNRAVKDYWFFDKLYFPAELYSDGYSEPSYFHRKIYEAWNTPGVQIILGPRKHGKTATSKKLMIWDILRGKLKFGATLSATLPTSRNILGDIAEFFSNPRIENDFKPEILEANKDQITLKIPGLNNLCRIVALSEGRSARGATFQFIRPQKVLCDDLETRQSPLNEEQTTARIKILQETYQSMGVDAVLLVNANNFDERCAINRLLKEQKDKILPDYWKVHVYKAWQDNQPLWEERYPAKSEDELKRMLKVSDHSEWYADFQQEPTPPDGFIFKRLSPLPIYNEIPIDAKGVLYCDPNLSKKGRGDTTAIVSLVYSATTGKYYIQDFVCKSFSDSNDLLNAVLKLKKSNIKFVAFDGNVSQESTWTNNVRNWCRVNNEPYPPVMYKRYHVDDLSKNSQMAWNSGLIMLPESMLISDEGKSFLNQMFAFSGKKSNKKDDAPDAMICSFEFIHERHLSKHVSAKNTLTTITDFFKF